MSQTNMSLSQKLFEVQKKIGALTKNSDNPFFKSKYADLNQVLSVAKEALHPYGLFLVQGPGLSEHGRYIETSILDAETGQQVSCRVPFSGNEKNMQEIGAATTYGRRFGVVSLLAMEQDDDDGETAVGRGTEKSSPGRSNHGGGSITSKDGFGSKAGTPVAITEPKNVSKTPREKVNELIKQTSKVIIDSKRDTADNVFKMLEAFGVKSKEELNDDQAQKLLTQLKEKLK